jgi:acyl dehydratase
VLFYASHPYSSLRRTYRFVGAQLQARCSHRATHAVSAAGLDKIANLMDTMPLSDLVKHVGEEMGVSSWTMLDQARITEFAHCTGDHQWIHVDAERAARESPFGGTIAHGFLTLSLIAPMSFEVLVARVTPKSVVNYGLEKVRFLAPVRSGKRVRNRIKLAAVEGRSNGRYLVTTENTVEIEGETKPALLANAIAIFIG